MQEQLDSAISLHQQNRVNEAIEAYNQILIDHGENAQVFYLLAAAHYMLGHGEYALIASEQAFRLNPAHPANLCLLGHIHRLDSRWDEAITYYQKTLDLQPNYQEALVQLMELCAEHEQPEKQKIAQDYLERLLENNSSHPHWLLKAAQLAEKRGDADQALDYAQRAIHAKNPSMDEAHEIMGRIAAEKADYKLAEKHFRVLLKRRPDEPGSHYNLGYVFYYRKQYIWAVNAFESALELDPDLPEANFMAGKASCRLKHPDKALERLERYAQLSGELTAEYHYFKGEALRHKKELRQAIVELQQALLLKPDYTQAYQALGGVFRKKEYYDKSLECFHRALEIDPSNFDAILGISIAYKDYKKENKNEHMEKALEYAHQALDMRPKYAGALYNMANVYMDFGLPHQSIPYYQKALDNDVKNASSYSSCCFNSNYLQTLDRKELFEQHRVWGERYCKPKLEEAYTHTNDPDPERKIRLGFISPDFRVHPVAYFFRPVYDQLDREQFEIFMYYNNYDEKAADAHTNAFKQGADHWYEIQDKKQNEVAELIHDDRVDILIDLAGHSCGHKLLPMAFKPAPLQGTWLGYPNTSGSSAIDFRITDPITDPHEDQEISVERILHLPTGFNCYRMPYKFPQPQPTPALDNGYITFGSFNNSCKHNKEILRLWSHLLHAVPNAKIAFKDKYITLKRTQRYVLDNICQYGISEDRVMFLDFAKTNADHLKNYAKIDIALDPSPYNGTTTTCEALMMGVPVLTFLGDRHAARVSASILSRVGLSDWIAQDEKHMVAIAKAKASNIEALQQLRMGMRDRVLESPLCDAELVAREFRDAMRDEWRNWCQQAKQGTAENHLVNTQT